MVYPGLTTLELIGTVSVLDGLGFETGLQPSVWSGIATLPIFAWEAPLGIWLIVKNFNPSVIASEKFS